MKTAVIVTPFDNYSYQVRIRYVEQYLLQRGYDVKVISSDFDHRKKERYCAERTNLELIHVPSYQKNLSIKRIMSHLVFSQKVKKRLEGLKPNLIYCSAPPNFLFKYVSDYKKNNAKVTLIYELGDLWPETLPLSKRIKKAVAPALKVWSSIRDKNIGYADGVVFECDMFYNRVSIESENIEKRVIYLSKQDYYKENFALPIISNEILKFAYVGSINNIIDIDLIIEIMKYIGKHKVAKLVIIGGGEKAAELISLCEKSDIKYENHGIVYDEYEKHNILSNCQFGLNIMKNSVAVGATMKSLEYFHEGLILINNIPYDTEQIINQYCCGFNVHDVDNDLDYILHMSPTDVEKMRMNSRRAYEELFSMNASREKYKELFDRVGV